MDIKTVVMPRELTAENGAKYLLSGEFSVGHFIECGHCDNGDAKLDEDDDYEECELCEGQGGFNIDIPIEWTTIKDIYAKAVQHLGT